MLFTTTISGAFGAARVLSQGTDFNCNSSICYAIGAANHALLQQLQGTLNQYAKLGLSAYTGQLTVDGFIGAQTVTAARAAAAAALLASPGSTKEAIASNAQILQDGLQAFLGGVTAPRSQFPVATSTPTPVPSSTPIAVVTPPTSVSLSPSLMVTAPRGTTTAAIQPTMMPGANPAAASLMPIATSGKVPTWVWVTAGVAGVVVVGAVGYAVLREPAPKKAKSKSNLARRRRRR